MTSLLFILTLVPTVGEDPPVIGPRSGVDLRAIISGSRPKWGTLAAVLLSHDNDRVTAALSLIDIRQLWRCDGVVQTRVFVLLDRSVNLDNRSVSTLLPFRFGQSAFLTAAHECRPVVLAFVTLGLICEE